MVINEETIDLETLKLKFGEWRSVRPKRTIHPQLWSTAVVVARREGVARTAKALGLSVYALKRRVGQSAPTAKTRPRLNPQFVELPAMQTFPKSLRASNVQVHIHCGQGKEVLIDWENPGSQQWEHLFSGLLRAGTDPSRERL